MSLNDRAYETMMRAVGFVAAKHAAWQGRRFEAVLERCRDVQEDVLVRTLRANQDSDFGRRHGFDRINSYSDFANALPLARFGYFSPYIDRCCAGDSQALLGPSQKLQMFALTSATTGPVKYVPVTGDFVAQYRRGWNVWGVKAMQDHPEMFLGKMLQVSSPAEEERTAGGHPCGAISGMLAQQQKWIVRQLYAVPADVFRIGDPLLRYYAIMRFAIPEDIRLIVTANPSTLLALAKTASARAQQMIREIHDGTIDTCRELSTERRSRLAGFLKPNRRRSRQLERLLDEHGRLLPKHYWTPALLAHWTGGTVGCYLPRVKQYYGDAPVRDIGLLASEGRMSIPLEDGTAAGVLDIQGNFYEFVPAEEIHNLDLSDKAVTLPNGLTVLRADQLDKGREYFVFLTNRAGLYRYHIGDMVRVMDSMGSTPIIKFVSRGAHVCSVTGEKLTEHQIVTAVNTALNEANLPSDIYTVAPVLKDPPFYVLYVESKAKRSAGTLEDLARNIDNLLQKGNIEYASKRKSHRIGPLTIQWMENDELTRLDRQLILMRHGRSEQFKHCFLQNRPFDPGLQLQTLQASGVGEL